MKRPALTVDNVEDPLVTNLRRYLYENSAELWAHLPPKDMPFVAASEVSFQNPFERSNFWPKPKSLDLSAIDGLYGGIAFAMRRYGIALNTHLTIVWRGLGINDHRRAASILSRFNKEAAAWLRVGDRSQLRVRHTRRSEYGSSMHLYGYVHECSRGQGFHTHQLMFVPPEKAVAFETWAVPCLTRLSGRRRAERYAIYLSPRTGTGFKPHRARSDTDAAAATWRMFRYVIKSLPPGATYSSVDGIHTSARDVLKPFPYEEMLPIYADKVVGMSENISAKARISAGFRSRLDRDDFGNLYGAGELEAYKQALEAEEVQRCASKLNI
jgi:hypothetical protein